MMKNKPILSRRVKAIAPSASIVMTQKVRDMRQAGIDVINFSTGEPNFDTPAHIREAAVRALREGYTHYTPSRGYPELLEALATVVQREYGLTVNPHRQIIFTPGAKQAVLLTLLAVINDGDEVLAPSPCWLSYGDMTTIAGGNLVYVGSNEDTGFVPTYEDMEKKISSRTRAIIVNNPCNPTGAVWSREQLLAVVHLAQKYNLLVISDEAYDKIVFDDYYFISMASLEGMAERVVVINSFSKTYAMTGWRIGYLIGPERLVEKIAKLHQHSATCITAFGQMAALAALTGPQDCVTEMVAEYQRRRNLFTSLNCSEIKGTFYTLMSIEGLNMDSVQATDFFLRRAHVAMTPGVAYGEGGERYLRISFAATSQDTISEALRRIELAKKS